MLRFKCHCGRSGLVIGLICLICPWISASIGQEGRVYSLLSRLRCLSCRHQSIADSDSEFAHQIRDQVLAQVKLGVSDSVIEAGLHQEYGDFIRWQPPYRATTSLLWFLPVLLCLAFIYFGYR
ncbi:MAG: cytochrome c-type biogenesis protein CcmH [Pseudomonadota bacterium]|nr:cytochrome c-type biogenesis protein CcmH [Pseudomonadota bacterium]